MMMLLIERSEYDDDDVLIVISEYDDDDVLIERSEYDDDDVADRKVKVLKIVADRSGQRLLLIEAIKVLMLLKTKD